MLCEDSVFRLIEGQMLEIVRKTANFSQGFSCKGFIRPKTTLQSFLRRLQRFLNFDLQYYLAALALLLRLSNKSTRIPYGLSFKLLVTCLFLIDKTLGERPSCSLELSLAGSVPIAEIVRLERDVVRMLDYRILVSEEEFEAVVGMVVGGL